MTPREQTAKFFEKTISHQDHDVFTSSCSNNNLLKAAKAAKTNLENYVNTVEIDTKFTKNSAVIRQVEIEAGTDLHYDLGEMAIGISFNEYVFTKKHITTRSYDPCLNVSHHVVERYIDRVGLTPNDLIAEIMDKNAQMLLAQILGNDMKPDETKPFVYAIDSGVILGTIVKANGKSPMRIGHYTKRNHTAEESTGDFSFGGSVIIYLRTFVSNKQLFREQREMKAKLSMTRNNAVDSVFYGDIEPAIKLYSVLSDFVEEVGYDSLLQKITFLETTIEERNTRAA